MNRGLKEAAPWGMPWSLQRVVRPIVALQHAAAAGALSSLCRPAGGHTYVPTC